MREIPVTDARAQLAELVNQVAYGGEAVVLTRHGRRLVALVPVDSLPQEQGADAEAGVVLDLGGGGRLTTVDDVPAAARQQEGPPAAPGPGDHRG
ncbi:type II toxin-antitoxin system Phd/YefM family antitoxin [Nocardioides sp.]|uniref:type II toxin-antitoxin system Phd/YefM family antitoxin n=1 Tax=Nocardioides sp. TaxID=35761 RepID=UPI003519A0E9